MVSGVDGSYGTLLEHHAQKLCEAYASITITYHFIEKEHEAQRG